MSFLRHLPNALTCGNLLCGCLGIVWISQHDYSYAAYFVWAACVFDFLDGFAARILHSSSPIGKELDSLADMVSFGVLPTLTVYRMMTCSPTLAYISFLIAVCSALRLAKFNIDETQSDSFKGLPTPAAALFLSSLGFLPSPFLEMASRCGVLVTLSLVISLLMVSRFELFALKFKNFNWAGNQIRFTFILLAVLVLLWLKAGAIPFLILLYLVMSLISRVLGFSK
jgi:CDP-diacylglycerol---serine O-phosphatidyltransferase